MTTSETSRGSCCQKINSRIKNMPRGYIMILLALVIVSGIIFVVCMGLSVDTPYATSTSAHGAAIKGRIPDATTVIYATVTATAVAAVMSRLSPPSTQTNILVQRGFTPDAIAGICVAVICGVLLVLVLLSCVARCLTGRLDQMSCVGDHHHHHAGHCNGENHSVRSPYVENVITGYPLRDFSAGGGNAGGHGHGDLSASGADRLAGYQSTGDHIVGEEDVAMHTPPNSFAEVQPLGSHPVEEKI